jgi:hypothetical protein
MNNKNILNHCLLAATLLFSVSCTSDYEDINSNPYQPGSLAPDDYSLGSAMNNLAGCVISPDVNTAQFTECLTGGPYAGYFADSNSGFNESALSRYIPRDDWARVLLKSDRVIPVLYSNLTMVKNVVRATNDSVPLAIATVIKVAAMDRVTDAYGPIPYSQIGADGKITIPYDSQESIYNKFFEELNWSINYLNAHIGEALTANADYVYGGNVSKWVKFANSLKLRLAMRISYAAPEKSKQMAEDAVNAKNGGVIESNADNAKWNYFGSTQNPLYVATRYNQATGCVTGGDTHAAADIICYMNGYNDPRREKYFVKSEFKSTSGADNTYVGLRHGIVIPGADVTRQYSGVNVLPSDPLMWLNASEVAFLRAEGAAVHGYDMGGSAETFYNDGIRLSFEQCGASGADAYLAQSSGLPTSITYKDPAGLNSYEGTIKLIPVKWDESATTDQKLERIIVQKWIANWQLGCESWCDIRRTGYPVLIPATEAGNASGGIVNSLKGARRLPYPLDEYVSNSANVKSAVSDYLLGADNMATDVWWAGKKK